jgi:hypothetical protein
VRARLVGLLVYTALAAGVALAVTGCGGGARPGTTAKQPDAAIAREHDGDGDNDSLGMGRLDTDNDASPTFGRPASPTERQQITALFKGFYTAAAADNGARACSMLYWLVAETVVEEHSHGKGPLALRGTTCTQIATKLFKKNHRELVDDLAALKLTIIQLRRNRGWAVLDFAPAHERLGTIQREGTVWKLGSLLKDDAL